jgi:hypothetical protein
MMRRLLMSVLLAFVLSGCGLFDRNIVARAGGHELTVDWFAETLVEGDVLLQHSVVERWAWMWVQYSLLLQQLVQGDSLLDTTTVREAMWPEVLTGTVQLFFERLASEQVIVDSSVVDSAYRAGNHRVIDQILVRGGGHLSTAENSARQRQASRVRTRLAAGGSWSREAQATDDYNTQATNGRLGVITRGENPPEFEDVAFSLEPGELSAVVETQYGFHVVRRPELEEVRDLFEREIREILESRWRVAFADQLSERRNVSVTEAGPDIIRDAADRPIRILALAPGRLVGTYDGGRLTDSDFVGWLQALPVQEHMSIEGAPDELLNEMARDAMQWEVLFLEAKSVGTTPTDSMYSMAKNELRRRIARVRSAMRADSALANVAPSEWNDVTARVLEEYMKRILTTDRDISVVPPFLARKLRAESSWKFSYGGLERAIERAEQLKAARDTVASGGGRGSAR